MLLALSFRTEPGSPWFYPAALALAAAWAVGALVAGPPPLGDRSPSRPVTVGLALGALFVAGALVVREIPSLDHQVGAVTAYADRGAGALVVLVAVVTGVSEELFFRGVLYDQVPRQPVLGTCLAYTLVTLVTGNAMLVLAAAVLGIVVARERRRSGGVVAPALVHATWSLVMLLVLPRLF